MAEAPRSLSEVPPRQGILLGLALTGLGTFIELLSFDVITPSGTNTPPLIGAMAGGLFLMPGLLSFYYAYRNHRRLKVQKPGVAGFDIAGWLVGSVSVTAFSFIGGWVSLAGDARGFSGSVTASRIAFGIGSVICAACAAVFWSYGFNELRKMKRQRES